MVEKVADRLHQLVAIRVNGITIVALYLAPSLPKSRLLEILRNIQRICRGPTIVLGHLNGRHPEWGMRLRTGHNNTQGNTIHTWARQFGWEIRGTVAPTYESRQGKSTIDIFMVKGVPLKGPVVAYGPWDGASDHHPVTGESSLPTSLASRTFKIPKSLRNKDNLRIREK